MAAVNRNLLGGLSTRQFLRRHWHKTPLLVRNAVPGFHGLLDLEEMFRLAGRDDCESRLVLRQGSRWQVEYGPFARARLRRLPQRDWTLLLQGVDLFLEQARDLLSRFNFIPHARLDDLMVSHAAPGGGVGPHFDSYDVFLLQGAGRRRWRVGRQRDLELRDDVPLKILRRFAPEADAVLDAGDMLYLPPQFAHDGVALEGCQTYSIGFRAPTHRELASEFLMYLEERLALEGRYADPDLALQAHPAHISEQMVHKVARVLREVRWSGKDVADFLGTYLSEPKPSVRFSPPPRPLGAMQFRRLATRDGVRLAPGSRMLVSRGNVYLNGEVARGCAGGSLRMLADHGRLAAARLQADVDAFEWLYRWYRAGYILPGVRQVP